MSWSMYVYVHVTFPLCFRMGIPWGAKTLALFGMPTPQDFIFHKSTIKVLLFLSDTNAQCQDLWKQQIQDQAF